MTDHRLSFVPKLAKKARLRFDRHSGKYMIVYPERGLVLNDSAAAIVKQCDGTQTIDAIATVIAREENADRDEVTRDVLAFVHELEQKGLLEP